MLYERLLDGENNVRYVGELVNVPTLYTSKNGKQICRFTLERRNGKSFTRVPCVLYSDEATLFKHIADKGARIDICGELGSIGGELVIIGGYFTALDARTKKAYNAHINSLR